MTIKLAEGLECVRGSVGLILSLKNENIMTNEEQLTQHFSRFFTGFCTSSAILEDYAKVVAKIEGVTEKEVYERVKKRAEEIGDKINLENQNMK